MLLDDLHWAEPTALQLLRHLVHAVASTPLMVVLSCRDIGEADPEGLRLALADLEKGGAPRLSLVGLEEAELAELVRDSPQPSHDRDRRASGADDLVARLAEQTAGHPLYATQLLRYWDETGDAPLAPGAVVPRMLRDVVWSRVNALGPDATDVLMAAAVLGLEFDESVLVKMVDVDEPVVVSSLDAATRGGLLVGLDDRARADRFVHSLVANALYSDLGGPRCSRLHRRAAEALTSRRDAAGSSGLVALARHCFLGGLPDEAQRWFTAAGDAAFDDLSAEEAARHYRAALDLAESGGRPGAERADLLVRLGGAQERAGDAEAFATLAAGAELARRCGAHATLARAALATDRGSARVDGGAHGQQVMIEAAFSVADRSDQATYARLAALLAQNLTYAGEAGRRVALAREALAIAETIDDPALFVCVAVPAVNALMGPARASERATLAERAIAAAERSGDPMLAFRAHILSHTIAIERGDRSTVERDLARMRATTMRYGTPRMRWMLAVIDTFHATMEGRIDEAETLATAALDAGRTISESDAFTVFAGQYYSIATFAGRHAELFPLVEEVAKASPELLMARLGYGILCSVVGQEDEALEILEEGLESGFSTIPSDTTRTTNLVAYSILAIDLRHVDAALVLLPLMEPFAAEVSFTGITSQGPIAAYIGKLASLLGDHDLGEQRLLDAYRIADQFGWTYHRATTKFAMAEARYRRLGSLEAEGRAWLDEATELCTTGGYDTWLLRIEALEAAICDGEEPSRFRRPD